MQRERHRGWHFLSSNNVLVLKLEGALVQIGALQGDVKGKLDVVQFLGCGDEVFVQLGAIDRVDTLVF